MLGFLYDFLKTSNTQINAFTCKIGKQVCCGAGREGRAASYYTLCSKPSSFLWPEIAGPALLHLPKDRCTWNAFGLPCNVQLRLLLCIIMTMLWGSTSFRFVHMLQQACVKTLCMGFAVVCYAVNDGDASRAWAIWETTNAAFVHVQFIIHTFG
jgi:hypothetical protein